MEPAVAGLRRHTPQEGVALSEKRGCFKIGCLGCLGVAAVVLLVVVVLVVLGLLTGGREGRIEPFDRAQPIRAAGSPGTAGAEPSEGPDRELVAHEIDVAEPGRIVLDLNRGSFEIRPGPSGEPIRLEGRYDAGRFNLTESYETYGETGWTYRVSFEQRGFGIRPFIQHEPDENRVRLIIPRDAPIVLEGRVGVGESELELGGLWLLGVDLDIGIGEHTVSFGEPLPIPLGRLRLDASIGALIVDGIGNASPREVWVKHSIGEVGVDLRGPWRRDAEVFVRCGIGECDVRVPRNVDLEMDRASVTIGEASRPRDRPAPEAGQPTLKLSVSGNIGEVQVH
jgi:hypothetical protein